MIESIAVPISDITLHALIAVYFLLATLVVVLFSPWMARKVAARPAGAMQAGPLSSATGQSHGFLANR